MQLIKACPFCGTIPTLEFDQTTSMYKLECKSCLQNNIILYCLNDTHEGAINIWNNRVSLNHTNILNLKNFGYLILSDLRVLDCELFSHGDLLAKEFNLKFDNIVDFDVPKFCFENGIIKVTAELDKMGIDLPYHYTQKQINILIEILNKEQGFLSFTNIYFYDISKNEVVHFTSIKDTLNYLLELKIK